MSDKIIISECKEPWLYWWLWLPYPHRKRLIKQYFPDHQKRFPDSTFITPADQKTIWAKEKAEILSDNQWLQLAQTALIYEEHLSSKDRQEIWRQVYRIASERI